MHRLLQDSCSCFGSCTWPLGTWRVAGVCVEWGIACSCYGLLKESVRGAVALDSSLEIPILGTLSAKHRCEINVTPGSWSFCVIARLLCSSNCSLLLCIGNKTQKIVVDYYLRRKIFIPTESLLVLWYFMGACWLWVFHWRSQSNGTLTPAQLSV